MDKQESFLRLQAMARITTSKTQKIRKLVEDETVVDRLVNGEAVLPE